MDISLLAYISYKDRAHCEVLYTKQDIHVCQWEQEILRLMGPKFVKKKQPNCQFKGAGEAEKSKNNNNQLSDICQAQGLGRAFGAVFGCC